MYAQYDYHITRDLLDHVRQHVDKRDIERAWENIDKWRMPLSHADPTLYDELRDIVDDFCTTYALDPCDFEIEELFNNL